MNLRFSAGLLNYGEFVLIRVSNELGDEYIVTIVLIKILD